MSFKKFDVPHYQFEMDQLSLSALLSGRLVPEGVSRFERDYSSIDLPIRYLGVQTTEKMSKSLLQDVTLDSDGQIYALDRGNCQVSSRKYVQSVFSYLSGLSYYYNYLWWKIFKIYVNFHPLFLTV